MSAVERWAERDALRQARRFLLRYSNGEEFAEDELVYLRGQVSWLLLSGALDETAAGHLRHMLGHLDREVAP